MAGFCAVLVFMHLRAEAVTQLSSYASQGALNNLTEIFHLPALMFFGIIMLYALSELYKCYRAMNDPESYRKKSVRRAGVQVGRKAKRATIRPGTTAKNQQKRHTARKLSGRSVDPVTRQLTDQSRDRLAGLSVDQITKPSKNGRTRGTRVR